MAGPAYLSKGAGRPVVWLSHGFGYDGDLLYFGEIFREFESLCSPTVICVAADMSFRNPYGLPLLPILHFWRIRRSRKVRGAEYAADVALPSPFLLAPLVRLKPRALIVIEFTPAALLGVVAMLMRPSIARILLVESDPSKRGGSKHPLVLAIKRWVVKRMDAIQTNTAEGRAYLLNDLGAVPDRVHLLPYLTSRPPGPSVEPAHPGPVLQLLFVNSLTERKGITQLIESLHCCSPETRARLHLTVVGQGPLRDSLERRSAEFGLADCVSFEGPCSYAELHKHFLRADVLVIPSLADYRSLSSFEGLAYGLALLGSEQDGASTETIIPDENGYVIDPHDIVQIAERLRELSNDRGKVFSFKKRSRDLYIEKFSVEKIAQNLTEMVITAEKHKSARRGMWPLFGLSE